MNEDDPALAAVLAAPGDTDCLRVYVAALSARGDDRADFTRHQLALHTVDDEERPALLATLRRTYPADRALWLARLEQAGAFEANLLELPDVWWGVGLGARSTNATYQGFQKKQPPLPVERLDGSFDWLRAAPAVRAVGGDADGWRARIAALRDDGFLVPPELERLMTDPDLQRRVPSCTDSYFVKSEDAELHPQTDGSAFLTFWSDSQACVLWGIRLGREDRYAPVLAGTPEFPDEDEARAPGEPYLRFPDLVWSSPTLEAFVYRTWIENTIWYATEWDAARRPLTGEEQAYLDALVGG